MFIITIAAREDMMADDVLFPRLYDRWAQAVADRDRGALDELFHPEYTYTSPEGHRLSREEILEIEMVVPPPQLPFLDFTVQRFGDTAVVRGRHGLKGELPEGLVGSELAARVARGIEIAFTSVWWEGPEGWRVMSNDAHAVTGG